MSMLPEHRDFSVFTTPLHVQWFQSGFLRTETKTTRDLPILLTMPLIRESSLSLPRPYLYRWRWRSRRNQCESCVIYILLTYCYQKSVRSFVRYSEHQRIIMTWSNELKKEINETILSCFYISSVNVCSLMTGEGYLLKEKTWLVKSLVIDTLDTIVWNGVQARVQIFSLMEKLLNIHSWNSSMLSLYSLLFLTFWLSQKSKRFSSGPIPILSFQRRQRSMKFTQWDSPVASVFLETSPLYSLVSLRLYYLATTNWPMLRLFTELIGCKFQLGFNELPERRARKLKNGCMTRSIPLLREREEGYTESLYDGVTGPRG